MRRRRRLLAWAAGAAALALVASACGDDDGGDAEGSSGGDDAAATLTLYNAQHEELGQAWVDAFTEKTGIKVKVRSGSDFELANLIAQEGNDSPADVFITENSPAMNIVDAKGLFAPIDAATLAQVPPRFVAGEGRWMGIAARSTVFVYNPSKVPASSLPTSLLDLAKPEWKGRVGVAAAGADFQAIVSAVLSTQGRDRTAEWLKGLEANAKIYRGNGVILRAVNAGEVDAGVIYHYYWYRDRAESGANSSNTELLYFTNKDPGAFLSLSGGGVLKSSDHPDEAQQLLAFITGPDGQKLLAESDALEYPIGNGVAADPTLKPLSELDPPDLDLAGLNGPETIQLMQDAGLL